MALPKLPAGFNAGGIDMAKMARGSDLEGEILRKAMSRSPGEGIAVSQGFLGQAGFLPSGPQARVSADLGSKGLLRFASGHPGILITDLASRKQTTSSQQILLLGTTVGAALTLIGADALWHAMELARIKGAQALSTQSGVAGIIGSTSVSGELLRHGSSPIRVAPSLSAGGNVRLGGARPADEIDDGGDVSNKIENEIEDTEVTAGSFLEELGKQFDVIKDRFWWVAESLPEEVSDEYVDEIEDIERRVAFWTSELGKTATLAGREREEYERDILIGERLLLNRMLRIGADIFSEPLPEGSIRDVGLRDGKKRKPRSVGVVPEPSPETKIPPDVSGAEIAPSSSFGTLVPALIGKDVGYGEGLALWPHQEAAHDKFIGLVRLRNAMLEMGTVSEEMLRGTIVMPVGGGKTRTMVATFGAMIAEGAFSAARKDAFIILNHTDRIHGQNMDVAQLLGPYFEKKFGRPLRVTEYKADNKDVSGDVIVVSIPSVNTEERRGDFKSALSRRLGTIGQARLPAPEAQADGGQVVSVAVDEIHHLEMGDGKNKGSWRELMKDLRSVSPNLFRVGFTATPTGREGPYITRIRELDLMRSGVTPRTYFTKIPGIDLTQLKVSSSAIDFPIGKLVSTLIEHPKRNRNIYEALEKSGLRGEATSPSGRARLEPTLFFAADLQHAAMMARDHKKYFGEGVANNGNLRGRNIRLLGENGGMITEAELARAVGDYQSGAIDGITVVVSGKTNEKVRNAVLSVATSGEIEAVFNVDVWFEGADLWMFTHLVGARPTFSRYKKAQERGRVNRRGPNEFTRDGMLIIDRPRIVFDVMDEYHSHDRQLSRYSEVMGLLFGEVRVPDGALFDVLGGKVVEEVDRLGGQVEHESVRELMAEHEKVARPAQITDLDPLVNKLWEILDGQYDGDVNAMAIDLGISEENLRGMLEGKGWINERWFMRRVATLLYQDRSMLVDVFNDMRGLGDPAVTPADMELVKGALTLYREWEGVKEGEKIVIRGGPGGEGIEISGNSLYRLQTQALTDRQWRNMWRGIYTYFEEKAAESDLKGEVARKWSSDLVKHYFEREGWNFDPNNASSILLFEARRLVARRFGGGLQKYNDIEGVPQTGKWPPLKRWLAGEEVDFEKSLTAEGFYLQIRSLLVGLGMKEKQADLLIELAIFENKGWGRDANSAEERALLEARRLMARQKGGEFPTHGGIEGISFQNEGSPLTRWLEGKGTKFGYRETSALQFYTQLKALFVGLGMEEEKADSLVEAMVFEKNDWEIGTKSASERLRFEARCLVARKFGGVLPIHTSIEGIAHQRRSAPLARWIEGSKISFSANLTAQVFYQKVRMLLVGLGMDGERADSLIEAAVFEENGWESDTDSASARLRFKARCLVAQTFGGVLPTDVGIEGVPMQKAKARPPLANWLAGGEIRFSKEISAKEFYMQVRSLLVGLGMDEKDADLLIEAAVFEQNGWENDAVSASAKLSLEARRLVARKLGGVLPQKSVLEGVPAQPKKTSPLRRWLTEGDIAFGDRGGITAREFYAHVGTLLVGLGMDEKMADSLIRAAVFEQNKWERVEDSASARLLFETRCLVAKTFGGVLPDKTGIEGIPVHIGKTSVGRWLNGEKITIEKFYTQLKVFLIGLGMDGERADSLIEAAVFEQSGWESNADSGYTNLRLKARRYVVKKFGGKLPGDVGIEGVPFQSEEAVLTRWLAGKEIEFGGRNISPSNFYQQIYALLIGLGLPALEATFLIQAAREEDATIF